MATTPTAARGLSTPELDGIRDALAAGRKPKVVFTESAGQIAGQVGQVVKLADPAESDEWITVRFGRDELPFSPGDLAMPPPARSTKKSGATRAKQSRQPAAAAEAATAQPAAAAQPAHREPSSPGPAPRPRAGGEPQPANRAPRAARSAKAKTPATVTVTLAYDAGGWTVAAHQGSKILAKPHVIKATDALKMVAMLHVPGVHDVIEQLVAAELDEAARRADTLRAELAEVESRLAELRGVG